jgi:hypothetical protein
MFVESFKAIGQSAEDAPKSERRTLITEEQNGMLAGAKKRQQWNAPLSDSAASYTAFETSDFSPVYMSSNAPLPSHPVHVPATESSTQQTGYDAHTLKSVLPRGILRPPPVQVTSAELTL